MPPFDQTSAPGARVLIRDEEWIVRNVEPCDVGGYELECLGVSETVCQREETFLSAIDDVRVLDPRATELVGDGSPRYIASLLYLEARLRQTIPADDAITVDHRAAMDTMSFQLEPARRSRTVAIDSNVLATFTELYDPAGTSSIRARLPAIHSQEPLAVLWKLASHEVRLGTCPQDSVRRRRVHGHPRRLPGFVRIQPSTGEH
jgi:hypothetical protein